MAETNKAKKAKYKFFRKNREVNELRQKLYNQRFNRYYNIWMSKFKWSGLDEENKEQEENYIMRKAWSDGKIAVRQIKNTDLLAFMPFTAATYNMYDFPETVNLINERSVPTTLIPNTPQIVNKDVVIGYFTPSHKPICDVVRHYCDLMVQAEMVINTNLQLQNMPFLIGVDPDDEDKMRDIVDKILNNEIVVYADLQALQKIQSLVTSTPYLVDKLKMYIKTLEEELLTIFGIDNNNGIGEKNIVIDAINANNDIINQYNYSIEGEMNKWINRVNVLFNRNISIKNAIEDSQLKSIHEEINSKEEINDDTMQ